MEEGARQHAILVFWGGGDSAEDAARQLQRWCRAKAGYTRCWSGAVRRGGVVLQRAVIRLSKFGYDLQSVRMMYSHSTVFFLLLLHALQITTRECGRCCKLVR